MFQTAMLNDVFSSLQLTPEPDYIVTKDDLPYADDTLLASHNLDNLQRPLASIVIEGTRYGLALNWS